MTEPTSQADFSAYDPARVRDLTAAVCDDLITPSELEELQQILLASAAARELFLGDLCVHAGVEWDVAARGRLETLIDSCRQPEPSGNVLAPASASQAALNGTAGRRLRRLASWAVAAALVVGATQ